MENKCGKKDSSTCKIDCADCTHADNFVISSNPIAPLKLMRKIEGIAYGDYFNAFASLYSVLEQRKELVNHMKLNLIKKEHHEMLQYLDNIIKDVLYID